MSLLDAGTTITQIRTATLARIAAALNTGDDAALSALGAAYRAMMPPEGGTFEKLVERARFLRVWRPTITVAEPVAVPVGEAQAQAPRPPHPLHIPANTPEGLAEYRQDVNAALGYAVATNTPTSWRLVNEQRARVASFPTDDLYLEISALISEAKRQADGYTPEDRARVWTPRIDTTLIDAAIAEWRADDDDLWTA